MYLCRALSLCDNLHHRHFDLLWRTILQNGIKLSSTEKERILSLCFRRAQKSFPPLRQRRMSVTSLNSIHPMAVDVPDLGRTLAACLFPRYHELLQQDALQGWAHRVSTAALGPTVPLETRWSNLLLLAFYMKPHVSQPSDYLVDVRLNPESVEWRTILILATLDQAVSSFSSESRSRKTTNILRLLWKTWKDTECDRPLTVTQSILATFLRLSAIAGDTKLFEACAYYCDIRKLSSVSEEPGVAGALHTLVAYFFGLVKCKGAKWCHVFQLLEGSVAKENWRTQVIEALLQHFTVYDIDLAYELYQFCQARGLRQSVSNVHHIATSLAVPRKLHLALPFLRYPAFSPRQLEDLLGAILRVFQALRPTSIDPGSAGEIGNIMQELYAKVRPREQFKYPIRFFLSLLISSGHPMKAVKIVEALHQTSPAFFTPRLFTRLIAALFRQREFRQAVLMLRIARQTTPSRTIDITHDKLVISMAKAGATEVARTLYQNHGISSALDTRLSMVRATKFRMHRPTPYATIRILRLLFRCPSNEQAVKDVVTLLVRAGRMYAARKLLESKCHDLTPNSVTVIGNTILHGPLLHGKQRNGRLVRHMLHTRMMLEKTCKFITDRLTTNIVIKAILRWRAIVDVSKMKGLFDHFVRLGYPAGQRWCQRNSAPFGTPPVSLQDLEIPLPAAPLSFKRHVRPLYKMFIKAFYLRGDTDAAKTVIGILKEEEAGVIREREKRERARREGIRRKKARMAASLLPVT
ncbi:hypothetical protein AX17_007353 [Amanita inopinata Kibby_2008]|nr:hypothetical protein AX17_007353 [Amanita inopinata Kibby_2008]